MHLYFSMKCFISLYLAIYIYLCLHFYLLCFLNIFASIPYLDFSCPQNEGEFTSRGSSIQLGITFLILTKRGRSNINSYVKTCFYIILRFNEFRFCNHQKGGDCWYKNAIYISQYLFVLIITKRKNIKRKVNTKTSD